MHRRMHDVVRERFTGGGRRQLDLVSLSERDRIGHRLGTPLPETAAQLHRMRVDVDAADLVAIPTYETRSHASGRRSLVSARRMRAVRESSHASW